VTFARDPKELFERYGRQLLVSGVEFDGQQRLHRLAAVFGAEATGPAQAAAEVCARYLVGAGLGRAVAPSAWAASLADLDRQLTLVASPADAPPPVAQFWFASRPYGGSVDIALTDRATDWASGDADPARVATLRVELGQEATDADAVAWGTLAADLLVADQLGLDPLPALAVVDWRDPAAPAYLRTPHRLSGAGASGRAGPGLLAEYSGHAALRDAVAAEACARYPCEACGLIVRGADGVLEVVATPNLQDRYHALDPAAYPRTARTAYTLNERLIARQADLGKRLVAIWHSHCDAGAYFSAEDARCAAPDGQPLYPGVSYLVVSVIAGRVAGERMFHWDSDIDGYVAEGTPVGQ